MMSLHGIQQCKEKPTATAPVVFYLCVHEVATSFIISQDLCFHGCKPWPDTLLVKLARQMLTLHTCHWREVLVDTFIQSGWVLAWVGLMGNAGPYVAPHWAHRNAHSQEDETLWPHNASVSLRYAANLNKHSRSVPDSLCPDVWAAPAHLLFMEEVIHHCLGSLRWGCYGTRSRTEGVPSSLSLFRLLTARICFKACVCILVY